MKKGEASKKRIVKAAGELFWKYGYGATGVSDILRIAGLPKGSFYFYFKSKSDVAKAVIEYYNQVVIGFLHKAMEQADSWGMFCDTVFSAFCDQKKDRQYYGCPLAVLGMELSFQEEVLAGYYREAMNQVKEIFIQTLRKSGLTGERLESVGEFALSVYEGNLLLYRISRDQSQLARMRNQMKSVAGEEL
ncbi:MAG: TetR/AcrR family transcriptional regulator [Ruminococcus sp.]|jgi:AcrR family transcriptional regulator